VGLDTEGELNADVNVAGYGVLVSAGLWRVKE